MQLKCHALVPPDGIVLHKADEGRGAQDAGQGQPSERAVGGRVQPRFLAVLSEVVETIPASRMCVQGIDLARPSNTHS